MKKLLTFLIFVHVTVCVLSQDQGLLNYKTFVRDSSGKIFISDNVALRVSVLPGNNRNDTVIYQEFFKLPTDKSGQVSFTLGTGSAKSGNLDDVDWSIGKYFMRIETDPSGKEQYVESVFTQILIVPYVFPTGKPPKPTGGSVEDKLLISRKYIGRFLDYRQTTPKASNGMNIIWIKTTMESTYGKLSAFGKRCDFVPGDNLYIKRSYMSPGGISGYWVYYIENDSSLYYRLSDYQYDRKVGTDLLFR